jgi:hypothetical protein
MGRCVEERSDTPVDPELADGSEPLVYCAVARLLSVAANHRKIVRVEGTAGGARRPARSTARRTESR